MPIQNIQRILYLFVT